MKQIEKTISPLIDSLFPSFYQDEGENFVAFIKAYYEWLEQNFQIISLESNAGFVKGGRVTQANVTGTIYSIIDGDLLVKVDSNETFKCFNVCSELIPITTVNDSITYSTYILRGGTSRRLGSIFISRNLLDYRDIDETIDLFVVFFKEKYLRNIEFDTATNKQLLVKNALDLYRSKGTERAIDLFFRLIYGVKPEVEYPADVLFQPSGAEWFKPTYLEISPNTIDRAITLVGKEITGVTSGAKAFVEKYIKLKVNAGYSHVLFVSNVKGNFSTKELIIDDQLYSDSPVLYGSLSNITINSSAAGFSVGDIIAINTSTGINGLARVTETRSATGQVAFELVEQGYGYALSSASPSTIRPQALVADTLLTISNVVSGNIVSQIAVTTAGTGYSNGDIINIPSTNGANAQGLIVTTAAGAIQRVDLSYSGAGFNVASGSITGFASGTSGAVQYTTRHSNQYYQIFDDIRQSNTSAPVAIGKIIGGPITAVITLSNVVGNFTVGQKIYQSDPDRGAIASGTIVRSNILLSSGTLTVSNVKGAFRQSIQLLVEESDASATFESITLKVPVDVTSGTFQTNTTFIVSSVKAGFTSNTAAVSSGSGASFNVFELGTNKETIRVNVDTLSNTDILALPLDSLQFNLLQSPVANVSSNIFGALQFQSVEIGEVKTIAGFNPGSNYVEDPFILMYQPYVANEDNKNLKISVSDVNTSFLPNEIVTQTYTESVRILTVGSTASLRVNERLYVRDGSLANVANVSVKSIANSTVMTVNAIEGTVQNGNTIRSYSNNAYTATISQLSSADQTVNVTSKLISQIGNALTVKPMNYNNDFIINDEIVGARSGATGTIVTIEEIDSLPMGFNSIVLGDSVTANGEIKSAQIIDSGFGYLDTQTGSTVLDDGRAISYTLNVDSLGTGSGSYRSLKGFLSDLSKLHDGDFYQEYSYNIISKISFDKYAKMFKQVLHTAGTRFFGSVLLSSVIEDTKVGAIANTNITISTDV